MVDSLPIFPADRPGGYDADKIWTPTGTPYEQPTFEDPGADRQNVGGGRWGQVLVVAGDNSVYYEALM